MTECQTKTACRYIPPQDFSRGGSDDTAPSRYLDLNASSPVSGHSFVQITIWRPPVVLNYGLWSDPTSWYGFGFDSASIPLLARCSASRQAAAQADVVAHSMGGIITRAIVQLGSYPSNASFGTGSIHKLITIGTPHLGSPLVTDLLQSQEDCLPNVLTEARNVVLLAATVGGAQITGALGDLQGCANNSLSGCLNSFGGPLKDSLNGPVPSFAIQFPNSQFYTGLTVPNAFVVGQMDPNNPNSVGNSVFAKVIQAVGFASCLSDPLIHDLAPGKWSPILNGSASDGIVSDVSQMNNQTYSFVQSGDLHTSVLTKLGFSGTAEVADPIIASDVRQLGL